ncbi:MAG: polysaccharide pyruvyl transferase family protein [Acidobacteriota bacterium]
MAGTALQEDLTHLEIRVRGADVPPAGSLATVLAALPAVRSLTVLFEGVPDTGAVEAVSELHRHCRERGLNASAAFVLAGDADASAALGRQDTSLRPTVAVSRALTIKGVAVRWWIPIVRPLVYRLEALFSLARDERIDPLLVPASLATLTGPPEAMTLDGESVRFVHDFVVCRLLAEERSRLTATRARFYQSVADSPGADPEIRDDVSRIAVLERDDDGDWQVRQEPRPSFTLPLDADEWHTPGQHDRRGPGGSGHVTDIFGVFAEGGCALGQWARTTITGMRYRESRYGPDRSLARVLVIGAYGGDHIGDTAIVGGVLLRMHRRYGTKHAILVSQRPEHTARLTAMLDVPVSVTVHEYRQSTVAELLAQVDGVVFAGGPLMDLPKQLVKHLYAVSRARRDGKPFIIEGIGAGPFIRRLSAWTARLLVRMADEVTVRTSVDAKAPLVRGLRPRVGRDPAFDYLETRGPVLTRMPDADRQWLERLLTQTEGRVTVGINLRPLRPDYTAGAPAARRAEYTRFVEARFEERLAEAVRQFHKATTPSPCFVFFPMNAIQFGSSDLRSAYRIKRLVRGEVDFHIWEGDPSIDGVIALLRRVDVAITMRFHATIYALSQRKPVIGIDYRPGTRDKVAALLADAGAGHNCGAIDTITTEWLVQRLTELTGPAGRGTMPGASER